MNNEIENNILHDNEIAANKQMINILVVSSIMMLVIWVFYLTGLFPLNSYTLVNIFFPINILISISSAFWIRTKHLYNPKFKYFLLNSFLGIICILNIIVPKHAIIGWAAVIVISNHYYNPKTCRIVFASVLFSMLICIYLGMLLGEYDPNLLTSGKLMVDSNGDPYLFQPDGFKERLELAVENNRFFKVFIFYYLSRAVFLTVIFVACNGLNIRTHKLLTDEINITKDKERINIELSYAAQIQSAALPNNFIKTKKLEIIAEIKPTKEVGGDLYDYLKLDDNHVAFIIGDVSGKGIPAAMLMMKTITCFENLVSINKEPGKTLEEINNALCKNNEASMFVTAFIGIIDLTTGIVKYSNAAHNPPLIRNNNHSFFLDCPSGFVLGGIEGLNFDNGEFKLASGDSITLYTDGITEAKSKNDELFGDERLLELANSQEFSSMIKFHYELKDKLKEFTLGAEQSDDITLMSITYEGDIINDYEKIFNKPDLHEISSFVDHTFNKEDFINDQALNIKSLIKEIINNIISNNYDNDPKEIYLRIEFNKTKNNLILTFIDKGKKNNPFVETNINLSHNYNYVNNKNILEILIH